MSSGPTEARDWTSSELVDVASNVCVSGPTETRDWMSSELVDVAGNVCVCDVRQLRDVCVVDSWCSTIMNFNATAHQRLTGMNVTVDGHGTMSTVRQSDVCC